MKLLTFLLALFLTGCSFSSTNQSQPYNGAPLTIGTTGIAPEVTESSIRFIRINLKDIETKNPILDELDAIFITADYFEEGSTAEYDHAYKELSLPIFFIESQKAHVPFTDERLTYETTSNFPEEQAPYISGIYYSDDADRFRSYGVSLTNVGAEEQKIQEAYTAVFKLIDELIHEKASKSIRDNLAFSYLRNLTEAERTAYEHFSADKEIRYLSEFSPEKILLVYLHSVAMDDVENLYYLTYNDGTLPDYDSFRERYYSSGLQQKEQETALEYRYYDSIQPLEENINYEGIAVEIKVVLGVYQRLAVYNLREEEGIWKVDLLPMLGLL